MEPINPTFSTQPIPKVINISDYEGLKILIVEDDKINQLVVCSLLNNMGVCASVVKDGTEAIQFLNDQPDCQIVLMDIQMPIMGGHEATCEIRKDERFSNLPIIAMTADNSQSCIDACLDAGMDDYINKPFSPEQIYTTIAKWISHSNSN